MRTAVQFVVILVLACLAGGQARAEGLIDVLRLAQREDPAFRGSRQANLASREGAKQAKTELFPTLMLGAESGGNWQNIRDTDNQLYEQGASFFGSHRISLILNQPIYSRAALVAVRQARSAVAHADLELEIARQALLLRVVSVYFGGLVAQDELGFAQTEHESLTRHHELVEVQRGRGLASLPDLYEARSRLASVEAALVEAEDRLDDAYQGLYELTGREDLELSRIHREIAATAPNPADLAAWVQASLADNLQLLALQRTVDLTGLEVDRIAAGALPVLSLSARSQREWSGGSVYGGGSDIETASFLVRLDLPLLQGGMLRSQVRQARHHQLRIREELKQAERRVQRETRAAFLGVTRAISRMAALKQAVLAQELALQARSEGFATGVFSSVEVLDTERDLFQVRQAHSRARYDYVLNSLGLRAAAGILSEEDLMVVDEWLH